MERIPPEHDFNKSREAWEQSVFENAHHFVAILYAPHQQFERQEFEHLGKAIECARKLRDAFGRTGMLYAVTATGRAVYLDSDKWAMYLASWKRRKAAKSKQRREEQNHAKHANHNRERQQASTPSEVIRIVRG